MDVKDDNYNEHRTCFPTICRGFAILRHPSAQKAGETLAIRQAGGLRYAVAQASSPAVSQASSLPQWRGSGSLG
jgi:hypothetical protein